jgi:hypothetical protein
MLERVFEDMIVRDWDFLLRTMARYIPGPLNTLMSSSRLRGHCVI